LGSQIILKQQIENQEEKAKKRGANVGRVFEMQHGDKRIWVKSDAAKNAKGENLWRETCFALGLFDQNPLSLQPDLLESIL
jgi:hypothetical protein